MTTSRENKLRARGKRWFVYRYGVWGWGLFTWIFFTLWIDFFQPGSLRTHTLQLIVGDLVSFVLFLGGGYVWGLLMWSWLRRRF